MIKVYQTKFTDEARGKLGNCLAACLASFLELPLAEVPAFEESATPRDDFTAFLEAKGYGHHIAMGMPPSNGKHYMTAFAVPNRTVTHCVIVLNGVIVHDPRGDRAVPLHQAVGHYIIYKKRTRSQS